MKPEPKKRGAKKTTVQQRLGKITFDIEKVKEIARFGATDAQLARVLGVDERTIRNWKTESSEFISALKEAKDGADSSVVRSLWERANGYSHKAVKIFCNAQGKKTVVPYVEHYPPDPTSCIFWLKNRQPDMWRDKREGEGDLTDREIEALREVAKKQADL